MTRLKVNDIADIAEHLPQYEERLLRQTGRTLKGIACHALEINQDDILAMTKHVKVCVIPFSCGRGIISGFAHAVAEITAYMGFASYVTEDSDVQGLADAFTRKADIIFLADDERFITVNLHTRRVSDNGEMTAKGFVAGLELMAGGLKNRSVLVIGCGPVGRAAVKALLALKAKVAVYDIAIDQSQKLLAHLKGGVKIETDLSLALKRYHLLLDAAPAKNIIDTDAVSAKTIVVAPGMPCGATPQAAAKLGERLLHDPLQIGVACMLADAIAR